MCDKQTHVFSETNGGLDKQVDIITLSTNTIEEQHLFAKKAKIHNLLFLSDNPSYQFGKKTMTEAVEGSLKRLKTDYLDLYQLHWPERNTNMFGTLGYVHKEENDWNKFEDVLGNLKEFISQGKIRYIGLSNETPCCTNKFLEISKDHNLPRMMSIQNPYSLLNRTYEVGLAEISIREEIGLLAYSCLLYTSPSPRD